MSGTVDPLVPGVGGVGVSLGSTGPNTPPKVSALDPFALLTTIRAVQQELSTLSNRDTGAVGSPGQPEYLSAFATAWHSDYRAPKGRRKNTTKHWWRTRPDPFADSWPLVEGWLMAEPSITAGELLTRLRRRLPDLYPTGAQLRTLQRRVKAWRAERARQLVFAAISIVEAAGTETISGD